MATMQVEVYEAFRELNVSDDKALKAAAVLGKSGDEIAALRTEIVQLRSETKVEFASVKGEQVVVRWMLGFMLAMQVAMLFKLFTH